MSKPLKPNIFRPYSLGDERTKQSNETLLQRPSSFTFNQEPFQQYLPPQLPPSPMNAFQMGYFGIPLFFNSFLNYDKPGSNYSHSFSELTPFRSNTSSQPQPITLNSNSFPLPSNGKRPNHDEINSEWPPIKQTKKQHNRSRSPIIPLFIPNNSLDKTSSLSTFNNQEKQIEQNKPTVASDESTEQNRIPTELLGIKPTTLDITRHSTTSHETNTKPEERQKKKGKKLEHNPTENFQTTTTTPIKMKKCNIDQIELAGIKKRSQIMHNRANTLFKKVNL